jgi:hypothetical protein
MRPDKHLPRRRVALDCLDDLPLRAASISDEDLCGRGFGHMADVEGNAADWGANHDDLGTSDPLGQVRRGVIDDSAILRLL